MAQLFSLTYVPLLNRNNIAIAGGQLRFRYSGTSTLAPIYTNDALTVQHTNPVIADATGKFNDIYLDPAIEYEVRALDANGAELPYEVDPYRVPTTILTPGLFTGLNGAALTGATRVITTGYASVDSGPASYAQKANAVFERLGNIHRASLTGNTTSGSAIITGLSSTSNLLVGMDVSGTGIPAGAKVLTIDSATQVTLTANATATGAAVSLLFTSKVVTGLRRTSDLTVGASVTGPDIPGGTTIASIDSSSQVTLSAYATGRVVGANLIWTTPINAAYVTANSRSSFRDAAGNGWTLSKGQTVTPLMFGCVNGLTTDNGAALQEYLWWIVEHKPDIADITLDSGFNQALVFGPELAPDATITRTIIGDLRLERIAGAALLECFVLRNMGHSPLACKIRVKGQGSQSFASRLDAVAIAVENCGRATIDSLRGDNAWWAGVVFSIANNNQVIVDSIWNNNCGSGHEDEPDWSLSGTWSGKVDTGSASDNDQRSTLTLTNLMPHNVGVTIKDYMQITETSAFLKINGELYEVKSINTGAGTVTIFPWLDNTLGASGAYTWVLGGGTVTRSGDGQVSINGHTATRCGIGLHIGSQYGAHVRNPILTDCGVGMAFSTPGSTSSGWLIEADYVEGNTCPYSVAIKDISSARYGYIDSDHNLNINRVYVLGYPRDGSNVRTGGEIGNGSNGCLLSYKGRHLQYERRNNLTAAGATRDFREHVHGPHQTYPIRRDSQTVQLRIDGNSGAEHRLLGWRGAAYLYHGTGTNSAPTGAIAFDPPTQERTCATTNGSPTVTVAHPWAIANGPSPAPTAGLIAGMPVSGTGIPGGTTILAVASTTQITLSANATATAASVTLTFTGSINGAFIQVSWSGFSGPAGFDILHTDMYQLQWLIRPFCGWRLAGSATWNPPNLASGASQTTDVTVTGAALGDTFSASFSLDLAGTFLSAYVQASNNVRVVHGNLTGGAVDLAEGTLTVRKVN